MRVLVNVASQPVSARILNLQRHFLHRPLERYVCAHGWQGGGGLYIIGTATLINTNVYANQAGSVCSPFELSSSAPLERYALVFLAGRAGDS